MPSTPAQRADHSGAGGLTSKIARAVWAGRGAMTPASVADFRELARRRLPRMLFDYIDGGSYAEVTLRNNVADFERVALRQRVMRDMSTLDLSLESLGQAWSMPVGLSPVGMAGMYARRGEVQA